MTPYRVSLAREVVELLRKLPLRQRQELTKFMESLEESPFQRGDYTERDDVGRPIEVHIMGRHALCYWADHAVKEVKVIDPQASGDLTEFTAPPTSSPRESTAGSSRSSVRT